MINAGPFDFHLNLFKIMCISKNIFSYLVRVEKIRINIYTEFGNNTLNEEVFHTSSYSSKKEYILFFREVAICKRPFALQFLPSSLAA